MNPHIQDPIGDGDTEGEFTLPDQRRRLLVAYGGRGAYHVIREETFPAAKHPGSFTRRAWERKALCGSLRAVVVGGDASDWSASFEALDDARATCARCLDRYSRMIFGGVA